MSFHDPYAVYVKTNSNSYIIGVDSSAFLQDTTGWEEIDHGYDDRLKYAQSAYFAEDIRTLGGAYRYKLIDGKAVECTAEDIAAQEGANQLEPVPTTDDVLNVLLGVTE